MSLFNSSDTQQMNPMQRLQELKQNPCKRITTGRDEHSSRHE